MMMKSEYFLLGLIFFVISCVEGYAYDPLVYKIQAGINQSRYISADLAYTTGFNVGFSVEKRMSTKQNKYLNVGLFLSKKGAGEDITPANFTINAYYLDIPVHYGFVQQLSPIFDLYEEFGPYVSYGLFGKMKSDAFFQSIITDDGSIGKKQIEKEEKNTFSTLKKWDAGIGLKIGLIFKKRYGLAIGSDFGLIKVNPKVSNARNFNFNININYVF